LGSRWKSNNAEITMLTEAFLLTPFLAIAASFALASTVAAICYTQPAPQRAGFSFRNHG
jgi:hypothetical protein